MSACLAIRTGTIAGVHTVSYIICGTLGPALEKSDIQIDIRKIIIAGVKPECKVGRVS